MLSKLLTNFKSGKNPKWQPLPHEVVKDSALREKLHREGYAIMELLDKQKIRQLHELYTNTHQLHAEQGGMFYGMYSNDFDYRKKIHEEIKQILQPLLDNIFQSYRNIINFFIVKLPGPKSELNIHQDMTAMDETKYSPLSLWIPLHDVQEDNGALCIVPRSHFMFSPYRSISFETPYTHITETIVPFLRPIPLKAGQALLFDPRILHHSLPNFTHQPRIAVVCGIFPEKAEIITCFKEPEPKSSIELLLQPPEYMLTNDNFFHNCTMRPKTGTLIAKVGKPMAPLTKRQFLQQCKKLGIKPYEGKLTFLNQTCHMIGEPKHELSTHI